MKPLTRLTRRSFVETAGLGLAAVAALAGSSTPSDAQLVYRKNDWHSGVFEKLMQIQARVKQVYDIRGIGEIYVAALVLGLHPQDLSLFRHGTNPAMKMAWSPPASSTIPSGLVDDPIQLGT